MKYIYNMMHGQKKTSKYVWLLSGLTVQNLTLYT